MKDPFDPENMAIAVVGRPHGVHGEVTVRPYNPNGTAFDDATSLILERDGVRSTYAVEDLRPGTPALLVKLAGVDDREAAAALTLSVVLVPRSSLPPLEPGEYYVEDVIGCAVLDQDGGPLGTAAGTFWNGAHDVVTVLDEASGREHLIPLIPEFVIEVDVPGRRIQVVWRDDE